jgi:uncharacterized protein
LIEFGADINATDISGQTPTMHAAMGGHPDIIEKLAIAGADIGARTSNTSALHIALLRGNESSAAMLLARGRDPDDCFLSDRRTALMTAAESCPRAVKVLIKAGANVMHLDAENATALSIAAQYGHVEAVRELVHAGSTINHIGNFRETRLGLAIRFSCTDAVTFLLDAGAHPFLFSCGTPLLALAERSLDARIVEAVRNAQRTFQQLHAGQAVA